MTQPSLISRLEMDEIEATPWAHVPAANGHAIDADGSHIVMSSVGAVVRLDHTGRTIDVIATTVNGTPLVYPNGVTLDRRRGGFYFTDSGYHSMPKSLPKDPQGRIYRVDADGHVRPVADGIAYANGVGLSTDSGRLYMSESITHRIWEYAVLSDGALGPRTLLAETPQDAGADAVPDGITVGPEGRLYIAHYGADEVLVYEPNGALVQRLQAGNNVTSHIAISPDATTIYISGGIESESGPGAIFMTAP